MPPLLNGSYPSQNKNGAGICPCVAERTGEHGVVIFAVSNDIYTPGAIASPANFSAYMSETFIP